MEHGCVGIVSDAEEHGADREVPHLAADHIAQLERGHFLGFHVHHLFHHGVGHEVNLAVSAGAVEHNLARPESIAAVNQCDPAGEACKEQRLFHRGVAAADHSNLFAAEEETVAGGA